MSRFGKAEVRPGSNRWLSRHELFNRFFPGSDATAAAWPKCAVCCRKRAKYGDWKANLVPPNRVAHSSEPGVSRSSRLWKDAHDAAREEGPTAGSTRPASGTSSEQCASCRRSKGMGVCTGSGTDRCGTVSSDAGATTGKPEPRPAWASQAWISLTGAHLLRKMWLRLLRQNHPSNGYWPSNEGLWLLPMQWIGWLSVWRRANLRQCTSSG